MLGLILHRHPSKRGIFQGEVKVRGPREIMIVVSPKASLFLTLINNRFYSHSYEYKGITRIGLFYIFLFFPTHITIKPFYLFIIF